MYSHTLDQLASQHVTEIRDEASRYRMPRPAREPRESIRERAGWTLIRVGLRLTDPPARYHARPRPAGL